MSEEISPRARRSKVGLKLTRRDANDATLPDSIPRVSRSPQLPFLLTVEPVGVRLLQADLQSSLPHFQLHEPQLLQLPKKKLLFAGAKPTLHGRDQIPPWLQDFCSTRD